MSADFPSANINGQNVHWAPLLVHPIADGPECFVAAIAAVGESGEAVVHRLLGARRLKAMFGGSFAGLGAVIDASVNSLSCYLQATLPKAPSLATSALRGWSSPLQGVRLGETSPMFAESLGQAITRASHLCAAFGEAPANASSTSPEASRWSEPVDAAVKRLKPQLSNSLNGELRLSATEHAISFAFLGMSLAANVVVLNPQRMAQSMREARAHLWNLSLLADAPNVLIKPSRLELLAGAREEGPRVREAIQELALEGGSRSVGVTRVESSEDAARQIIAMAA